MLNGFKAWMQVLKLGGVIGEAKEMNEFYKQTVLKVLRDEGWFTYLLMPRTVEEVASHFNYTDLPLLTDILRLLVRDKIIDANGTTYFTGLPVLVRNIQPKLLSQGNIDLSVSYATAIIQRLQGKYYTSTEGFNLFSFDDALGSNLYRVIRKAIMSYSDLLGRHGRFLDVGTGNGTELSHIFAMYLKKGAFRTDSSMEFHGIDVNADLLKIANEEFFTRVELEAGLTKDEVQKYSHIKPTFKVGTATNIPYPDKYFDTVYISQVLHWTDPAQAIREMWRVTKEGGKVIGGQLLHPYADEYLNLVMKVIDGAHGFFSKDEMKQWVREAGFNQASFATPVTTFVLQK